MIIRYKKKGFTLIELLIVIGIIVVLAAILVVTISPAEKLAQARDSKRSSDVKTIHGVIEQYIFSNNGVLPGSAGECFDGKIAEETFDAYECEVYLADFLSELPRDPIHGTTQATGYLVKKDSKGMVEVEAYYREGSQRILSGF
jgi:prepilin-type N-terminal cleavage/methylation domain-containing protein